MRSLRVKQGASTEAASVLGKQTGVSHVGASQAPELSGQSTQPDSPICPLTAACPLTRRQVELLQKVVELRTTNYRVLSQCLGLSPGSVKTEFARVCHRLGTHCRTEALLKALSQGWVVL